MKTTINMAKIENILKENGYASIHNEAGQYVKITLPDNDYWKQGPVHYEIIKSKNCIQLSIDVEGLAIDYSNAHIEAFTAQPADKTVTFYNDDAHLSAERCVEISGKRVTLMPYTVCAIKF